MRCPFCGSEYSLAEWERDFLRHSQQLVDVEARLKRIEKALEEMKK